MLVTIITGDPSLPRKITEYKVPNWTSQATCEQAVAELLQKHANKPQLEVHASCTLDGKSFVLPKPR